MDILGTALLDYYEGRYSEDITVHSNIAEDDVLPLPHLFRSFEEMPVLEQQALKLCKGHVLDIGCGAGSHALYLQKQKFKVTALDASPGAVQVAQMRGVIDARQQSLLDFKGETFDTLLLLMNGTGIFESTAKISEYLAHLHRLTAPHGQVLIDSSNIAYMFEDEDGGYWMDMNADYYGEVEFQLSYQGKSGAPFDWLYLDYDRLSAFAKANHWTCERIQEGPYHDYLARLRPA
ncbi:class I SAM-dependent methyltransferase [Croceiramulus getboli]|nr:class I SAM-dependent methyltransferase [Flavobacteriaceae bacterium YJPT1-3]